MTKPHFHLTCPLFEWDTIHRDTQPHRPPVQTLDMSFTEALHHTSIHPTSPVTSPNSSPLQKRAHGFTSSSSFSTLPQLPHLDFCRSGARQSEQTSSRQAMPVFPRAGQHAMTVSRDGWACMVPGCSSSLSPLSLWFPVPPSPKASSLSPYPSSAKRLSSANQIITQLIKTVGLVVHSSANRIVTPLTKTVGLVVHSSAN